MVEKEQIIRQYTEKGGVDVKILTDILNKNNASITNFLIEVIHKYSDLSRFPFSSLVELKCSKDQIDFDAIRKHIDDCVGPKKKEKINVAEIEQIESGNLLKPSTKKKEAKIDINEKAKEYVEMFLKYFRTEGNSDSEILETTNGEYDISLNDLFSYLLSDERELINMAIQMKMPYFIEKSVVFKPNIYKCLARLEILLRTNKDSVRDRLLYHCKYGNDDSFRPNDISSVSVHGCSCMEIINRDGKLAENINALYVATTIIPKEYKEIILRQLNERGHLRPTNRKLEEDLGNKRLAEGVSSIDPKDLEFNEEKGQEQG